MRKLIELLSVLVMLFLLAPWLTACGDVGSSSNSNVNNQNQIYNPDPISCSIDCRVNPTTGEISASQQCEGSTPFGIPVVSLDQCDSVEEIAASLQESEEESEEEFEED